MANYVLNTQTATTPGSGGGLAVTGATGSGHASTVASASSPSIQIKSCDWSNCPAGPGGEIASKTLSFEHTSSGTKVGAGTNDFTVDYSVDNGSNWTNAVSRTDFTTSQGPTTFSAALPANQDLTQVKVRDKLTASAIDGGSASVTATIDNIRIQASTIEGSFGAMM